MSHKDVQKIVVTSWGCDDLVYSELVKQRCQTVVNTCAMNTRTVNVAAEHQSVFGRCVDGCDNVGELVLKLRNRTSCRTLNI